MENNESLIIIPARGGSKGIPRKNLRPLAGHPLIYYVIKATKDLAFKARTIVTTDDEEIAKVSEYYGVDVIFRNKKLSNDSIPLDPVIFDAFQRAEKNIMKNIIIFLQFSLHHL